MSAARWWQAQAKAGQEAGKQTRRSHNKKRQNLTKGHAQLTPSTNSTGHLIHAKSRNNKHGPTNNPDLPTTAKTVTVQAYI